MRSLHRQSRQTLTAGLVALFIAIAWLDFAVDPDLSLFALYLIPIIYAGWFLGRSWGYASCTVSGLIWIADEWTTRVQDHHALIPYSNLASRLAILTIIVSLVDGLKTALEAEYEAERQAVQKDLEIARDVQMRLLPGVAPDYPGLEFGFFYEAARIVGGDYYDFIPFDNHRLGLAIADVSGKGLPSALLMASLQGLVRTNLAARRGDVAAFMEELNHSLSKIIANNRYATFFFAVVDAAGKTLHYANGGHNPPFLFRADSVEKLDQGGPPVGLFSKSTYQSAELPLRDGDVLVAYTDGITEALNSEQQEFGEDRLQALVQSSIGLTAAEICARVAAGLQAFVGPTPQWDDITLVVLKISKKD